MASITNEFDDLEGDVARHDSVVLSRCPNMPTERGLYDAEVGSVAGGARSKGLSDDDWRLVAARLAAVTRAHENEKGQR